MVCLWTLNSVSCETNPPLLTSKLLNLIYMWIWRMHQSPMTIDRLKSTMMAFIKLKENVCSKVYFHLILRRFQEFKLDIWPYQLVCWWWDCICSITVQQMIFWGHCVKLLKSIKKTEPFLPLTIKYGIWRWFGTVLLYQVSRICGTERSEETSRISNLGEGPIRFIQVVLNRHRYSREKSNLGSKV